MIRGAPSSVAAKALVALALGLAPSAQAQVRLAVGPHLLLTGDQGQRWRASAAVQVDLARRLALGACWCAAGGPETGLALAQVALQVAASPPRLWLRLRGDAGLAWSAAAPVVGAGAEAELRLYRALGLSLAAELHLVIEDVARSRALLGLAARATWRF